MAKRRCISVDVVENERFYLLTDKAKILYVLLMLKSDDDGVVINPKAVMRMYDINERILKELIDSGFVLKVDEVYIITHWCVHNKIPPSKKTDSLYQKELSKLRLSQTGEYVLESCIPDRLYHDICNLSA